MSYNVWFEGNIVDTVEANSLEMALLISQEMYGTIVAVTKGVN